MIQAVIFDLDGVIIDSEPIHFSIEQKMFKDLKIEICEPEHSSYVGMSSENMWDDIIRKYLLPYCTQELVQKKHLLYLQYLSRVGNLQPIDGIETLIKTLNENGCKVLVASSSPAEIINIVLQKFSLENYFTAKISGTELPQSKPHPGIFLKAATIAQTDPANCLVIEDAENGVIAAKAAGMKCIGYLNPNSGLQNLEAADLIISSFRQLSLDRIKEF
jgi:HAD superfamily hydrolase (TIGR01509 family)